MGRSTSNGREITLEIRPVTLSIRLHRTLLLVCTCMALAHRMELPRFSGQVATWESSRLSGWALVVNRRPLAERGMPTVRVIPAFDEAEDRDPCFSLRAEVASIQ